MKTRLSALFALLFFALFSSQAQHVADSFQNAQKNGVTIWQLDTIYKAACNADTSLSVFKTDIEMKAMFDAYGKMMRDLETFLRVNDFDFTKPAKSINRVYFSKDGSIDYFYFNFVATPDGDKVSPEQQEEFKRLLSIFIKGYRIPIKAKVKFSHFSPTTFTTK